MSAHARQQQPPSALSEGRHPAVAPTTNSVPVVAVSTAQSPSDSQQQIEAKNRPILSTYLSPQISSYFIAGGVAGAASRTVVSPLERLKIIQWVTAINNNRALNAHRINPGKCNRTRRTRRTRAYGAASCACGTRRGSRASCGVTA